MKFIEKKMVLKDRIFTILLFALPFVIIELLIGFWSMWNHPGEWSIAPWLGKALLVNLVLLIVAILLGLMIIRRFGYKPEKRAISAFVTVRKGQTPGKTDEELYTCGYGERVSPFELGDVSIPTKLGVQRDNVVHIRVDRLIMTPEGAYNWVNPRFLKLLPAKDNPKASNPEELERVWKESGRASIVSEDEEAPEADKRLCPTCSKPLDFISEYNAWYCTSCGKYDETTLPPPE